MRRKRPGFRSRFGGFWTDRPDAEERRARQIDGRIDGQLGGKLAPEVAERLRDWIRDGFVILPRAVPHGWIDALNAEIADAWARRDASVKIELGGTYSALAPELRARRYKLLDFYARSEHARKIAFAPAITDFLRAVFERELLLFQSLNFEHGSGDPIHQDTSSVVVTSPLEFAASWTALEDIREGSGELQYYVGSHRLPEFVFPGGTRNWNRERHGEAARQRYYESLHEESRRLGLELATFRPKKGDVLIWSADLAHGGGPVADEALTRRSLVCHYCPADVRPYYFAYRPRHRALVRWSPGCAYASSHYELAGTR